MDEGFDWSDQGPREAGSKIHKPKMSLSPPTEEDPESNFRVQTNKFTGGGRTALEIYRSAENAILLFSTRKGKIQPSEQT